MNDGTGVFGEWGPRRIGGQGCNAHGINANVVRRWRQLAREAKPALGTSNGFVPVSLPAISSPANVPDIQIQLRRGATAITISWPVSAAAELAVWLRELLR